MRGVVWASDRRQRSTPAAAIVDVASGRLERLPVPARTGSNRGTAATSTSHGRWKNPPAVTQGVYSPAASDVAPTAAIRTVRAKTGSRPLIRHAPCSTCYTAHHHYPIGYRSSLKLHGSWVAVHWPKFPVLHAVDTTTAERGLRAPAHPASSSCRTFARFRGEAHARQRHAHDFYPPEADSRWAQATISSAIWRFRFDDCGIRIAVPAEAMVIRDAVIWPRNGTYWNFGRPTPHDLAHAGGDVPWSADVPAGCQR